MKLHHIGKWKQREPKFFLPRARRGGAKETNLKTVLQASGITEAAPLDPRLKNIPLTRALRGQAYTGSPKKRRKKANTRRKPRSANMAKRRAPRTKLENATSQRAKNQPLLLRTRDHTHRAGLPQVNVILPAGEDGDPPHLFPNPTQSPTHPVDPGHEEKPGPIHGPEATRNQEVDLCPDPGLCLILSPGQDQAQGPGQDLDHFPSPGQDQGLGTHLDLDRPLERGVRPDLQGRRRQPNPKWTP